MTVFQVIPIWCCRMDKAAVFPTPKYLDPTCVYKPTTANSNYQIMCPEALLSAVTEAGWTVWFLILGTTVPLFSCIHLFSILFGLRGFICNREDEYELTTPLFNWTDNSNFPLVNQDYNWRNSGASVDPYRGGSNFYWIKATIIEKSNYFSFDSNVDLERSWESTRSLIL